MLPTSGPGLTLSSLTVISTLFTPVSRRRTPDKQWLPYNCFYSSLNAKYSILFLLLDGPVVRSSGRTDCVNRDASFGSGVTSFPRQNPRAFIVGRLSLYQSFVTKLFIRKPIMQYPAFSSICSKFRRYFLSEFYLCCIVNGQ